MTAKEPKSASGDTREDRVEKLRAGLLSTSVDRKKKLGLLKKLVEHKADSRVIAVLREAAAAPVNQSILGYVVRSFGYLAGREPLAELEKYVSHHNRAVVSNAVKALASVDRNEAVRLAMPVVFGANPDTSVAAARVLAERCRAECHDRFLEMVASPKKVDRYAVLLYLRFLPPADAVPVLLDMLRRETDHELYPVIARVLPRLVSKAGAAPIEALRLELASKLAEVDGALSAMADTAGPPPDPGEEADPEFPDALLTTDVMGFKTQPRPSESPFSGNAHVAIQPGPASAGLTAIPAPASAPAALASDGAQRAIPSAAFASGGAGRTVPATALASDGAGRVVPTAAFASGGAGRTVPAAALASDGAARVVPSAPVSAGVARGTPAASALDGGARGAPPAPASDGVARHAPPAPMSDGAARNAAPAPASEVASRNAPPAPISDGAARNAAPAPGSDAGARNAPPAPASDGAARVPPAPMSAPAPRAGAAAAAAAQPTTPVEAPGAGGSPAPASQPTSPVPAPDGLQAVPIAPPTGHPGVVSASQLPHQKRPFKKQRERLRHITQAFRLDQLPEVTRTRPVLVGSIVTLVCYIAFLTLGRGSLARPPSGGDITEGQLGKLGAAIKFSGELIDINRDYNILLVRDERQLVVSAYYQDQPVTGFLKGKKITVQGTIREIKNERAYVVQGISATQ